MRWIVIALLLAIPVSLGSGLFYLIKDKSNSDSTVRALTWRIGLSLLLFFLVVLIYRMGWVSGLISCNKPIYRTDLQYVNHEEQQQPDVIHEVPIPGCCFKSEMALSREMAGERAEQHDREHDGADRHVQAVKSRHHEKRRAIDAANSA